MFQQMLDGIKEEAVGFLFNLEVQVEAAEAAEVEEPHVEIHAKGLGGQRLPRNLQYSAPTIDGAAGSGGVAIEQQESAPALGIGGDGARPAGGGGRRGGARPGRGAGSGGGGARSGAGTGGAARSGGTVHGGGSSSNALGVGAGGSGGGARRSGPASPTAAGARKPSPGQAQASGGPSRNAPCYCGSGKKYKRCHGAPGAA
jgi:preprotein translocase subunit SecA